MAADGPRIIDFGIARAADATTGITTAGTVVGTFAYMSPEQIRGEAIGPPSDVFSRGSVLAFAATRRPPFGRDSAAPVMFRVVSQPPDLAGLADGDLAALIAGCLAKAPEGRPAVLDLLAAISGPGLAPALADAPGDTWQEQAEPGHQQAQSDAAAHHEDPDRHKSPRSSAGQCSQHDRRHNGAGDADTGRCRVQGEREKVRLC